MQDQSSDATGQKSSADQNADEQNVNQQAHQDDASSNQNDLDLAKAMTSLMSPVPDALSDTSDASPNTPDSPDASESRSSSLKPLGETFNKLLIQTTQNKLEPVHWFRTDWQRGGALTGYSHWLHEGKRVPVVVKLPVPPAERDWLRHLHKYDHVCPNLYAHGDTLGGYDFAWVIMERLPHGPLGLQWEGHEFDLLLDAAGRFYDATRDVPLTGQPPSQDWGAILHRSRQNIHLHAMPMAQRWAAALKHAKRKLNTWLDIWNNRTITGWCHGDLHLGNAMTRLPPPQGPALLLDFALTRPGHWVEDAVYLEHLFWARSKRLGGRQLCAMLAKQRHQYNLPVDADWPRLATIKRKLLALSVPCMLQHAGEPVHLKACLDVLENQ